MKKIMLFTLCITIIMHLVGCSYKTDKPVYGYEEMYKDSFDILINHQESPLLVDTLYTEMYIALKTCHTGNQNMSDSSCQIVLDRVERLLLMDSIIENQQNYLEAKQIVLSMQGKYNEMLGAMYQSYNLYPKNSIERQSSLAFYFLVLEKQDSALHYLNKSLEVSEVMLKSKDRKSRMPAIYTKINSLIYLNRDADAKKFVKEQLLSETDSEMIEIIINIDNDFSSYKKDIWGMVIDMKNKLPTLTLNQNNK